MAKTKAFEGAAWFKNEFGLLAKNSRNQKRYTAPEAIFNLDETGSCKTIHDRHEGNQNHNGPDILAGTPPRREVHRRVSDTAGMVDLTGSTRDSASHTSSSSSDDSSSSNKGSRLQTSGNCTDGTSAASGG